MAILQKRVGTNEREELQRIVHSVGPLIFFQVLVERGYGREEDDRSCYKTNDDEGFQSVHAISAARMDL